jgi:hypothetical protein
MEELAGVDRGLKDVDPGRFATPEAVAQKVCRYRLQSTSLSGACHRRPPRDTDVHRDDDPTFA